MALGNGGVIRAERPVSSCTGLQRAHCVHASYSESHTHSPHTHHTPSSRRWALRRQASRASTTSSAAACPSQSSTSPRRGRGWPSTPTHRTARCSSTQRSSRRTMKRTASFRPTRLPRCLESRPASTGTSRRYGHYLKPDFARPCAGLIMMSPPLITPAFHFHL